MHIFVVPFNYFEKLVLVIFMYYILMTNQQVGGWKSAIPHKYPPNMGNSSWLSDRDKTLALFKTVSKGKANISSQCGLASNFIHYGRDGGMYTLQPFCKKYCTMTSWK